MKNFSNSDDTGSFLNVRARLLKKMRATNVSERIAALLHETFETTLEAENMAISKLEKKVLMADISAQLLNELALHMKNSK